MTSKDNDGLTPLDIAKENRNEECIRLLFKAQKPEILVSDNFQGSVSRFLFKWLKGGSSTKASWWHCLSTHLLACHSTIIS